MVDQDPAQRGSQTEQRPRNTLAEIQKLRDRGDWPEIEHRMWQRQWEALGRIIAREKANTPSDNHP